MGFLNYLAIFAELLIKHVPVGEKAQIPALQVSIALLEAIEVINSLRESHSISPCGCHPCSCSACRESHEFLKKVEND